MTSFNDELWHGGVKMKLTLSSPPCGVYHSHGNLTKTRCEKVQEDGAGGGWRGWLGVVLWLGGWTSGNGSHSTLMGQAAGLLSYSGDATAP